MLDESSDGGVPPFLVAAKTVLDSKESPENTRDLQSEAVVMAQVGHHANLVSLVGVVTRGDPLVVIISYCEHGSLLSLLKKRVKERSPLSIDAKLKVGLETARGMQFLTSKRFIHRDLAARNVLIATGMVAQVADFGLSRKTKMHTADENGSAEANEQQQYYRSKTGVFPVRWTAPEAMEGSTFSPASDVWSFAIVMVEIYQNGAEPYNGMSLQSVIPYVMAGKQIERPAGCTAAMYELMCECWSMDPSERPTFARVVEAMTFYHKKVHPGDADGPAAPPTARRSKDNNFVGGFEGYGGAVSSTSEANPYEYAGTALAKATLSAATAIGTAVAETDLDAAAARRNEYGVVGRPNAANDCGSATTRRRPVTVEQHAAGATLSVANEYGKAIVPHASGSVGSASGARVEDGQRRGFNNRLHSKTAAGLDDPAEDKVELEFATAMKRLTDPQSMYSHGSAAVPAIAALKAAHAEQKRVAALSQELWELASSAEPAVACAGRKEGAAEAYRTVVASVTNDVGGTAFGQPLNRPAQTTTSALLLTPSVPRNVQTKVAASASQSGHVQPVDSIPYGRGIKQETAYGHSYPAPKFRAEVDGNYGKTSLVLTDGLLRPTMYAMAARAEAQREAAASGASAGAGATVQETAVGNIARASVARQPAVQTFELASKINVKKITKTKTKPKKDKKKEKSGKHGRPLRRGSSAVLVLDDEVNGTFEI